MKNQIHCKMPSTTGSPC